MNKHVYTQFCYLIFTDCCNGHCSSFKGSLCIILFYTIKKWVVLLAPFDRRVKWGLGNLMARLNIRGPPPHRPFSTGPLPPERVAPRTASPVSVPLWDPTQQNRASCLRSSPEKRMENRDCLSFYIFPHHTPNRRVRAPAGCPASGREETSTSALGSLQVPP